MRRIVVLSHRDKRHPDAGGATLYIHRIFERLASKYDVTIVSTAKRNLPESERLDGMQIVRIPFAKACRLSIPLAILSRLVGPADLLVDNGDVAFPWLTPLYSRKPILSVIYQIVGNIFRFELPPVIANLAQRLEPLVYRVYSKKRIVVCSPSTREDLVRFGISQDMITVIRPGIDESFRKFDGNSTKFDSPTILCISRFRPYKGLQFAIRAMKYVLDQVPDARLVIVGNGDDSYLRQELSRMDLRSNVSFLKRLPHNWNEEKKTLLSRAHALLVPSVREGYGIVVIEANACGTPAIGWNVPGLKDSIIHNETGLLASFPNNDEFAHHISSLLLNDSLWNRLSGNASKWARNHSWDKAAAQFEEVIKSVLG